MKTFKLFILILTLSLYNCVTNDPVTTTDIDDQSTCPTQNLNITDPSLGEVAPIYISATYNEDKVEVSYRVICGFECESKEYIVFYKTDNCIKFDYTYTITDNFYGTGKIIKENTNDIAFELQEWIIDQKLVGKTSNKTANEAPATNNEKELWVTINEDDYQADPEIKTPFSECLETQLPLFIDLNNDNINDFSIDFNTLYSEDQTPSYTASEVNINALNNNRFLKEDFGVGILMQTYNRPLKSENTTPTEAISNNLSTYIDYDNQNYKTYNEWESIYTNALIAYDIDLKDANLFVEMTIDNQIHYGWINFSLDTDNCTIQLKDTYLNEVPNTHITID